MAGKKLNALFVRVDDDDRAAILLAAERERVTVSELVRRSARGAATRGGEKVTRLAHNQETAGSIPAPATMQTASGSLAANTDEQPSAIQPQAPEEPKPPPMTGPLKVHHIDDLGADGLRGGNGALKR